jgi:multidrug resistance efflux pump
MMADQPPVQRVRRHPRIWWSRLKLKWPFLVWLGAIAFLVWIYGDAVHTGTVSGIIEVIHEEPAPHEGARLAKLGIREGQRVKPGEIIAEFDTAQLDAEIAQIKSQTESERFQFATRSAELDAQYKLDHTQLERQFEKTIDDGMLRLRELRFREQVDRSRHEVLTNEVRQITSILGTAASDARELIVYRAEMESLARSLALYPAAIRDTESDITHAREQLEAARLWTNSIGPVTNAIAAQTRYAAAREFITALQQRKTSYTIRANGSGIVSRVFHHEGDVLKASDPIATIVLQGSQQIIAFIPEWMVHDVGVGDEGIVSQSMRRIPLIKAKVTAIGPEIITLPGTVSPVANQPIRGRRAVLKIEGENDLMPGESVAIRFGDPAWLQQLKALRTRLAASRAP